MRYYQGMEYYIVILPFILVDELFPISNQANVSKKDLDHRLSRWCEMICLIISARVPDEQDVLFALGKKLSEYNFIDAAQIWYLSSLLKLFTFSWNFNL